MTREDAKDNILEYYNVFRDLDWQIQDMFREGVDSRIDEIYDYFEQRIKLLTDERSNMQKTHQQTIDSYRKSIAELEEPKTCEGCKWNGSVYEDWSENCGNCARNVIQEDDMYQAKDK